MVVMLLSPSGRRPVMDVLDFPGGFCPQGPLLLSAVPLGLCISVGLVLALVVVVVMVVMVLVILLGALPLHQRFVSFLLCSAALKSVKFISQWCHTKQQEALQTHTNQTCASTSHLRILVHFSYLCMMFIICTSIHTK